MEIQVLGVGDYLPPLQVENQAFTEWVETSDAWITSRTGIRVRHLACGESVWSMGASAARKALQSAGIPAAEIDVILVSTVTPDYHTPSVSCILQDELGAQRAVCMDINAACSGFVYAYDLAARYLCDEKVRHVLVVCAERLSGITDYSDRSTCVLFGDGAGAALIGRKPGAQALAGLHGRVAKLSVLGAEGALGHHIVSRAEYRTHPFQAGDNEIPARFAQENGLFIRMGGQDVYRFAVRVLVDAVERVLEQNQLTMEQIDWVVPHQANDRILEAASKRLGMEPGRMVSIIADIGNTSSASIPLCLARMVADGRLRHGQKVVVCGFGGGLTYGAALLEYGSF